MERIRGGRREGFSFLELLIVTAIAGILLTVAGPELPVLYAQYRVVAASKQVAVELQRARMRAVGENVFYRVSFDAGGTYVLQSSADGATFTDAEARQQLPAGVRFAGDLPQPTFNRLGALAAPAVIALTNDYSQVKVVQVNILGKVTIS